MRTDLGASIRTPAPRFFCSEGDTTTGNFIIGSPNVTTTNIGTLVSILVQGGTNIGTDWGFQLQTDPASLPNPTNILQGIFSANAAGIFAAEAVRSSVLT